MQLHDVKGGAVRIVVLADVEYGVHGIRILLQAARLFE